jgi:hypothetical protein
MDASRILWECTEDALYSLGKSAMQTIAWQMKQRDIGMLPDDFDIKRFAIVLDDLLGSGAETILSIICMNLCERLKTDMPAEPGVSALEKIGKVLEAKKMR